MKSNVTFRARKDGNLYLMTSRIGRATATAKLWQRDANFCWGEIDLSIAQYKKYAGGGEICIGEKHFKQPF